MTSAAKLWTASIVAALLLAAALFYPKKSTPVPATGWESIAWKYEYPGSQKICGFLRKKDSGDYTVNLLDADANRIIFNDTSKYASEGDAKKLVEKVCESRTR